ncbi:hypothetical protein BDN72DRAFT_862820 [Pluteus cervinus]|uniref:Uncharacterized protein n=1 Tax=Pluteus cervinus TaxID=181527 RepID=A0ACD3AC82_9AGAR|nr:hypothetical protein BDN72DRAFT_862820 [Pluteus cervinus]
MGGEAVELVPAVEHNDVPVKDNVASAVLHLYQLQFPHRPPKPSPHSPAQPTASQPLENLKTHVEVAEPLPPRPSPAEPSWTLEPMPSPVTDNQIKLVEGHPVGEEAGEGYGQGPVTETTKKPELKDDEHVLSSSTLLEKGGRVELRWEGRELRVEDFNWRGSGGGLHNAARAPIIGLGALDVDSKAQQNAPSVSTSQHSSAVHLAVNRTESATFTQFPIPRHRASRYLRLKHVQNSAKDYLRECFAETSKISITYTSTPSFSSRQQLVLWLQCQVMILVRPQSFLTYDAVTIRAFNATTLPSVSSRDGPLRQCSTASQILHNLSSDVPFPFVARWLALHPKLFYVITGTHTAVLSVKCVRTNVITIAQHTQSFENQECVILPAEHRPLPWGSLAERDWMDWEREAQMVGYTTEVES